jgi:drug/metabolite transporter (DMT)-like permease
MYSVGAQVLLCSLTIGLWGTSPILTRLLTDIVSTRVFLITNAIIQGTATCVINSVIYWKSDIWREAGRKMFVEAEWKRWLLALCNGVLCLSVPFIIYSNLLSNTHSITIIVCTTWYGAPIVSSLLSWWVFGQRITALQGGGILLCIGGIVMLNIETMLKEREEEQALLS